MVMDRVEWAIQAKGWRTGNNMREIIHTDEDGSPLNPAHIDDCFLANLSAPVVRSGTEAFKSYYVDAIAEALMPQISETMSDWG